MKNYEIVIGLETHIQLNTASKIFCSCKADSWGADPNTNICPVCLGMPGVLPVLNRKVVEFTIRMGLATHCRINEECNFARKNYFYPDLPKGYQISQYAYPLAEHGYVDIELEGDRKRIGITRIHMEEDAGKLSTRANSRGRRPRWPTSTAAPSRSWRSCPNPTCARPRKRAPTCAASTTSSSTSRCATGTWRRGRSAATPTYRSARRGRRSSGRRRSSRT